MKKCFSLILFIFFCNGFLFAQGNITDRKFTYVWNSAGNNWDYSYKHEYDYDSLARKSAYRLYSFNRLPINESKYFYNDKNQLSEEIQYKLNIIADSVEKYMFLKYKYDSLDRVIEIRTEMWDIDSVKWDLYSIRTYRFDQYNHEIENTLRVVESNQLKINRSTLNNYVYANNKLQHHTQLRYNRIGLNYDSVFKITFNYINDFIYEESKIDYTFSQFPNGKKIYKYINELDSNSQVIRITKYVSNASNDWALSVLIDSIKTKYKYDSNQELVAKHSYEVYKKWNNNNSQFEIDVKYIQDSFFTIHNQINNTLFSYNGSTFDSLRIYSQKYDQYNNLIENSNTSIENGIKYLLNSDRYNYTYFNGPRYYDMINQIYDFSSKTFVNSSRETMSLFTSIFNQSGSEKLFSIYPNPSSSSFHVRFPKALDRESLLKVYNLQSKLIQEHTLEKNTTVFELKDLAEGMYLIQYEGTSFKIIKY